MPIAASASASAAKMPSSSARKRGRAAESAKTCSIDRSLTIGSVASCARTAFWISCAQRRLRQARADHDVHVAGGEAQRSRGCCSFRKYSSVPVFFAMPALLDVAHDADDGERGRLRRDR